VTYLFHVSVLYIVHNSPFLRVWRWSNDSLFGSKWFDRWARICIGSERGIAGDFVYMYYFDFEINMQPFGSHMNIVLVL